MIGFTSIVVIDNTPVELHVPTHELKVEFQKNNLEEIVLHKNRHHSKM
ncbi:MAG: hypothetical protein HKP17_05915 [Ignavibacteriaceae bacterium]|nr:hypothetical protein [Ignavibacteria bacterium]NNJ52687.1 hypothetical protein [Ignavibacteriaceae bacterium]NNL22464.1 hypothetical protein [Ignavibacteriaceae bacterium]